MNAKYKTEVLKILGDREMSGRDLRAKLNEGKGWFSRWSSVSFYHFMARLETAGLVACRTGINYVEIEPIRVRYYRVARL